MQMTLLNILTGLGVFAGLCLAAGYALIRRHTNETQQSPARYGLQFEEIGFLTCDRVLLNGWWIPCEGSTRTVILLHGYAGSMDPDLKYVLHFHSNGYNILMFDFRAHGRSEGNFTSLGILEIEDLRAAVQQASMRGSNFIGLLGFSMGGRVALLASAHISAINAIVVDSAPLDLFTAVNGELKLKKIPVVLSHFLACVALLGASVLTRRNLFVQDVLCSVKSVSKPVLLIYGGQDPYVTQRQINLLNHRLDGKCTLKSVPEAGHRQIDDRVPDEYIHWLLDFFSKNYLENVP